MTSYWSLCSNFIWKSNIVTCVQRNEIKEMNFTGPLRESVNCDGTSQKVSDTLIEVENSCRRITRPSIDRLNISKCVEWQEHKVERKAATVTPSVGCVTFTRYTDALASILLMIVRRHWVHRNPFHRFNKLIDQFGAFYRIHANVAWFLLYRPHGRVLSQSSDLHTWILNWLFESLV